MDSYKDTILSQYANSPSITALVDRFNDWIDPSADLDNFYNIVWNVETAQGFGLDYWGRIVDVSRNLQINPDLLWFGFKEAVSGELINAGMTFDNDRLTFDNIDLTFDIEPYLSPTGVDGAQPFGQAPMWNGPPQTTTYALPDDAYRKLIMVKALANITDCTAKSLNTLLRFLFAGEGRCYVADTGSMSIRYVFEFNLTPVELSIMLSSGAIPRPAGVLVQVMQLDPSATFGFNEAGLQPLGSGTFFTDTGLQNAI